MKTPFTRRAISLMTSVVLVASMFTFAAPTMGSACEDKVTLPASSSSYNIWHDPWIDGVVTNDTSDTLRPSMVTITWPGYAHAVVEEWLDSTPIEPGEWVAFHCERPAGVPATATPTIVATAYQTDADDKPLPVAVTDISEASTDEDYVRSYTVTIENSNDTTVSSLDVQAIEAEDGSGAIVHTLDTCDVPDSLAPGDEAEITVKTEADDTGSLTPQVVVKGYEQPILKLSLDTNKPRCGRGTRVVVELDRADGTPAQGNRCFKIMWSKNGEDWDDYKYVESENAIAAAHIAPNRAMYLKAIYWGGDDLGFAESEPVYVTPKVNNDAPTAPSTVRVHRKFKVHGEIDAGVKSTGNPVTIITERRRGSCWVKAASAKTSANSAGSYSKSITLSTAGTYRVRAYRSGVGYTPYRSLKVTK